MKHILININDAYAQHCCVTLCSLFENNKKHKFHIHIFSFDLSTENQKIIKEFVEHYGNIVSFYILKDEGIRFPNVGNSHISKETYIRLFSPDYLPQHIERILYLDVDLLVLHDISELYSIPMNDSVIAAIEDYPMEDRFSRLGIPRKYGYFNAGVMMINIKLWKKLGLTSASMNILNKTQIQLKHHDQDVLNMLCYDKWTRIPFKWNILDVFFYDLSEYKNEFQEEIHKDLNNVCIIHFSGTIKPWNAWTPNPYYKYYYWYLSKTPWKGFKPSIKSQWNSYKFPRNLLTILKLDRILIKVKKLLLNIAK